MQQLLTLLRRFYNSDDYDKAREGQREREGPNKETRLPTGLSGTRPLATETRSHCTHKTQTPRRAPSLLHATPSLLRAPPAPCVAPLGSFLSPPSAVAAPQVWAFNHFQRRFDLDAYLASV